MCKIVYIIVLQVQNMYFMVEYAINEVHPLKIQPVYLCHK